MSDTDSPTIDAPVDELSLLEGIPAEKRASVLRCLNARVARFEKGDILAGRAHGTSCTRYLIEGEALIVRYDAAGNRSILGSYREDAVVASELAPQFCVANCLDIVATGPCTTIDFSISQEIEGCPCCIKHINRIKGNLVASLTDMNMQLVKRLDTLANRSTREKVLAYLQERSQEAGSRTFSIPYNRQELADYLYIERSALSRELSRMQREGIISYDRNRFALTS
ncbi:Crp/Fnr family transcriptional regulator [Eggerthella sp. NSJ-70]|uniref:Crp/Fnr family transcriptional regulator n=1 Tax=Eggerthella hominis TaxID=2763043 RepID=A0ABR7BR37_9ACTN|nr:Crp/Fnr family transcriptional regulator [Eggerthella hominis]MBC5584056.1 Crp/Fnr family transcriptional regulator [Eggerthella hominis]